MTDKKNADAPSFESTISELEKIVEQMETGDLPLDQALSLFERGVALSKQSQHALDNAEQRVKVLMQSQQGDELVDLDDLADDDA